MGNNGVLGNVCVSASKQVKKLCFVVLSCVRLQ